MVRVKYISLDSVKSVIFTKFESNMSQLWTKVMYKIDIGADGNLMPVNIFKFLFPKSTIELLHRTKIVQYSCNIKIEVPFIWIPFHLRNTGKIFS